MEQDPIRTNLWNIAARYGLALGLISSLYSLVTTLMTEAGISPLLVSLFTGILWVVKLIGCIWLMKHAMRSYAKTSKVISNKDTLRLGVVTAALSAVVFAAFSFASISYLFADFYEMQMQQVLSQMTPMMDSNSHGMVDKVLQRMPQISFFSNMIYCTAYGTVLSAILSRNIPSDNPFTE